MSRETPDATLGTGGVLTFRGRICFPRVDDLIETVLTKSHCSRYSIHPGVTKMYWYLRKLYWWARRKRDIAEYVSKCQNCQQVMYEHQRCAVLP